MRSSHFIMMGRSQQPPCAANFRRTTWCRSTSIFLAAWFLLGNNPPPDPIQGGVVKAVYEGDPFHAFGRMASSLTGLRTHQHGTHWSHRQRTTGMHT